MNLIMLSDFFVQVLNSKRKHPTKNEYFPMYILFTIFYLLQEQKLNHRNYSKQKIIMRSFVYANEHGMNMHAKIQCMNMHEFL
jgi:hypothetical protein